MANEFLHTLVGAVLTQAEFELADGGSHSFNAQATGDIMYASSATVLRRLGIGTTGHLLSVVAGIPAWTNSIAADTVFAGTTDTTSGATGAISTTGGLGITKALYVGTRIFINDNANANMITGQTIQQGAADNQAFTLKSSDIAHGLTSGGTVALETDDYFTISKHNPNEGGVRIVAIAENDANTEQSFQVHCYGGKANTAKTIAGGQSLIQFVAAQHDGANALADIDANGNAFGVRGRRGGAELTLFMVDEDADLFAGVANTVTALTDDYDDAHLLRRYAQALEANGTKGFIRDRYDALVRYHESDLVKAGVLGATIAEGGMWNMSQHIRVLTGAAWQARVRDYQIAERLLEAERRLALAENRLALLPAGRD